MYVLTKLLLTKFGFIQLWWWKRQSLPTSFHESQYDGWSSRMPSIVLIYSKHTGCVPHLLNRTDCYVWLYQKNFVDIYVPNAPDQWRNW